ncbi:MAG: glycosyltransferase family 87 protein [Phycisphaerales bacterium]|nr:glycosyltransferase family 87 protein [Phycisphaerales bacterium]
MIGRLDTHQQQTRIAFLIWVALIIGFCINGMMTDWSRSVTSSYLEGAQFWLAGADLYTNSDTDLFGFLYLPHAALLWIPFSQLPEGMIDPVWRVFTIGIFGLGCWRMFRVAEALTGGPMILLMTILAVLPALSTMRNGQATLPMTGMMMLGAVSLLSRHWWRAAIWLTLAVAIKPPAIALLLVVWVIYPALWWRMAVTFCLMLLLPFLAQRPEYVLECYQGFFQKVANKTQPNQFAEGNTFFAADFATFVRFLGIELSDRMALLIRVLAGGVTLLLSWYALHRVGLVRGTLLVVAWGLTYIVLFNPGTENNGYATVAPAMAMLAVMTLETRRPLLGTLLALMPILITLNYETMKFITPDNTVWFCAAVSLVFMAYLMLLTIGIIRYPWRIPGDPAALKTAPDSR